MSDLPFDVGEQPTSRTAITVTERKCRRHPWGLHDVEVYNPHTSDLTYRSEWYCTRCLKPKDEAASRRGRTNRKRGNALQANVAKHAGISNIGALGLPVDAGTSTEWLVLQVKSGKGFPLLLDRWLRALTATADQLRGVVYVETPGPGHRAKRLIVLDFDEFVDWFGTGGKAA